MALVELCGTQKPITLIPSDSGERRIVSIVAGLICKTGLAMTTNTFLNTMLTLRTGSDNGEK